MPDEDDEMPEAKGYDYTHCDCPECGEALEFENDCRGDVVECDMCQCKFRIT